ncbi:MAG: Multidomain signal transduction protein including CheB-like methylesterase, CheR-like methyltransferase and BaeS-like histidine kinase [uncultured Lysobacter sp.]|uniref:histidine kinase n=1 Tax=uncultured Lysobacter sp. TaxID=271060 RepID=A0A6J4M7F7_9GAMM|nr:MAG: Multidomain signal transduction protein including CheB-like methylesterase, CheR-like methyltransferase and BaeS-like histidine kinase [uncultured Lysobacter sp.]
MSAHRSGPCATSSADDFRSWFERACAQNPTLGPRENWPQPLPALVDLALNSKAPVYLVWGPELCMLYNQAYTEILGDRHPGALGQPFSSVWREAWLQIEPWIARGLAGEAVHRENERFVIQRDGVEQEAWFSFSNTPVREQSGGVAGIYCTLAETTQQVRAERQQADALAKLEHLFRQAPGFMAVTSGPEHIVELANEACMRLVGREDLVGRSVREAIPELAEQVYLDLFDRVYRTGEAFVGSRMAVHFQPPGADAPTQRHVDFVFQPIMGAHGGVSGVFVQGTDVTEHQQAQDALRQSEMGALRLAVDAEMHARRLDALLDAAPVGIIYADRNGRLEIVNAAIRAMWGDTPAASSPDDYVQWKAWWADGSERDGQPLRMQDWPISRALRGEEDARAVIEIEPFGRPGVRRTAQLQAKPVRTQDGTVIGAVVAEMDITEQVRMQARLRESEAKFRIITNAMPQMVWSTLPDGYHDYYNQRWYDYTGVPEGSTDGAEWNGLFHPGDQARAWEVWRHSLATGEPYEIEYRLRHHSGEYRWVLGRALPVHNERGLIVRWMGTCTDIHEQLMAQEMLQDASRRKDEFLAMLAHELRNPLAPITTAASVLVSTAADPQRVREVGEVIQRQARHMTKMVDDLLDVSRVTRGLVTFDFEIIDLKTVVRSAIEQINPLIEERGHQLGVWMPPGEVLVHGDRVRLVQVVANLLNNAAKYTRSGGRIDLELAISEGVAIVQVRDNGSGIDAQLLPHVFDLFTQGARGPDRSQGGLGIGLALARSVVSLHGGRITATSAGRGHGSELTVSIPLAELDAAHVHGNASGAARAKGAPLRVIVVDDNTDAARTIALLLQLQGHEVRVFHNAAAALDEARRAPAQLYVLDIGLPDMSGYELARLLRQDVAGADARLIAITGYGRSQDRALSHEAGFDLHLVKPVDAEQLLQAIATLTKS